VGLSRPIIPSSTFKDAVYPTWDRMSSHCVLPSLKREPHPPTPDWSFRSKSVNFQIDIANNDDFHPNMIHKWWMVPLFFKEEGQVPLSPPSIVIFWNHIKSHYMAGNIAHWPHWYMQILVQIFYREILHWETESATFPRYVADRKDPSGLKCKAGGQSHPPMKSVDPIS
jgi:hypothetical protein